ncbi:MAG TPA: precorrin-8X methylmutase [Devosiaceae bacterium]|nr:precorrin-8X methylmutase [Devosiaceae bacterium]
MHYLRDADAIYRESFAAIGREVDLSRFAPEARPLVTRLVHACGMPEIVGDLVIAAGAVAAGRAALTGGAPVICDTLMLAQGIVRDRLPAQSAVLCGLEHPAAAGLARQLGTTRSAAGIECLADRLAGAVVAIGNAPTALFRLLELLDEGWSPPALILGFPVGFVGAAESKAALAADPRDVPFVTLNGRRGGSAMAAAAVNALAGPSL